MCGESDIKLGDLRYSNIHHHYKDGCVYSRAGDQEQEEYCFKEGASDTVCTSVTNTSQQSALLERVDILDDIKILNKSKEIKTEEIGKTEQLTEDIKAAEEKLKKLMDRNSRQVGECEAIVTYVAAIENYTAANDTTNMQEMANNINAAEVTTCPGDINAALEEKLSIFTTTRQVLANIVKNLEDEIRHIQETLEDLEKTLADIETVLTSEFGLNMADMMDNLVDSSAEMPLALDTTIQFAFGQQIQEIPLALDFPVIDINSGYLRSLY